MRTAIRGVPIRLALAIATLSLAAPARAEWPAFGQAICTAPDAQTHPAVTTDGAGGAILAWQDHRAAKVNVFAQHVLASGDVDAAWPANGQAMLTDPSLPGVAGGNFAPLVVSDGAAGAVIAWVDLRNVTSDRLDIFAQHILATGVADPAWPANGRQLASVPGLEVNIAMVSDGAGGALVTWTDRRTAAELDVYAQHVLASGLVAPGWPANGIGVCTAPGRQEFAALVADGAGGAIIAWGDLRSSVTGADVYALRLQGTGAVAPGWPVNGRVVCAAAGDQGRPTVTSDGASGAIVAWTDSRVLDTAHIFAQHVLASGTVDPAWTVDGVAISDAGVLESRPLAIPDEAGGAIVAWQAFTLHINTYAQHVTAAGVVDPAWPAAGRALSITERNQTFADIAADGRGGAIVAWDDTSNVVAQHVQASGALDPAYPDTGRQIVDLPSQQGDVALVATGGGGAIVAWADTRNGKDTDIYAMQVLAVVPVSVPPSPLADAITFQSPSPNPARESLTLRFALARAARVHLAIHDVNGRAVRELSSGARPAGPHAIEWDLRDAGGHAIAAGVYFARLEVEGRALTQKLVKIE